MGDASNYGGYAVLGNLSVIIAGVENYTDYKRALDLKTGVHNTKFASANAEYTM